MYFFGPMLHFGNLWNSLSFDAPISAKLYNTSYNKFNVSAIVAEDLSLDTAAFAEAKPLLLTVSYILTP